MASGFGDGESVVNVVSVAEVEVIVVIGGDRFFPKTTGREDVDEDSAQSPDVVQAWVVELELFASVDNFCKSAQIHV